MAVRAIRRLISTTACSSVRMSSARRTSSRDSVSAHTSAAAGPVGRNSDVGHSQSRTLQVPEARRAVDDHPVIAYGQRGQLIRPVEPDATTPQPAQRAPALQPRRPGADGALWISIDQQHPEASSVPLRSERDRDVLLPLPPFCPHSATIMTGRPDVQESKVRTSRRQESRVERPDFQESRRLLYSKGPEAQACHRTRVATVSGPITAAWRRARQSASEP